jgi:inosose dehydratase
MEVKIAGAPISWGVCEADNWGHQMDPERVFGEMASLGLTGTEFGPLGFLPLDPKDRAAVLAELGMEATGGFFPIVLHDPAFNPMPRVEAELDAYEACGAKILVIAAEQPGGNYDVKRPELDEATWQVLLNNLKRIDEYAASRGITATVHPHVGTMIETKEDIDRVLEGTAIGFTFDTGHMFIGGTDPVEFSRLHADRVKHCHLKDCRLDLARKVQSGELTYYQATVEGMYTAVGYGDVDIRAIMTNLIQAGYDGWFCLEQDKVIDGEPGVGIGPIDDARKSVDFIKSVAASL